jgi:predicted O-methyltransferase YrrM
LESLNKIIDDKDELSSFDFIFIDADKRNYKNYYELGLSLLRQNGIILFDNVLWSGAVSDPKDQDANTIALRELNEMLYKDNRIELSMIPVGDGLTIVRKKEQ